MKILGSTQYVNLKTQKDPWYQLKVINQWDWKTKAICFEYVSGTLITFCLNLNTPKTDNSYKSEIVEIITPEIKNTLIDMGYIVG